MNQGNSLQKLSGQSENCLVRKVAMTIVVLGKNGSKSRAQKFQYKTPVSPIRTMVNEAFQELGNVLRLLFIFGPLGYHPDVLELSRRFHAVSNHHFD